MRVRAIGELTANASAPLWMLTCLSATSTTSPSTGGLTPNAVSLAWCSKRRPDLKSDMFLNKQQRISSCFLQRCSAKVVDRISLVARFA